MVEIIKYLPGVHDDGTTHIVMAMALMEKLAAIVPRPRVYLTRFHGVLAPHYKHRKMIVLAPKKEDPS